MPPGALLAHYSRNDEREADALGMEYMANLGYNPEGMVGLMEVLVGLSDHKPSAVDMMFSTHPMSSERLEDRKECGKQQISAHGGFIYRQRALHG